ncbi:hypothetical protein P0G10_19670 [Eubacteriales bacterium DFI.9.88]|nr:hypothetical protein [Eubacteriales bacterium DFI.9.88]
MCEERGSGFDKVVSEYGKTLLV